MTTNGIPGVLDDFHFAQGFREFAIAHAYIGKCDDFDAGLIVGEDDSQGRDEF